MSPVRGRYGVALLLAGVLAGSTGSGAHAASSDPPPSSYELSSEGSENTIITTGSFDVHVELPAGSGAGSGSVVVGYSEGVVVGAGQAWSCGADSSAEGLFALCKGYGPRRAEVAEPAAEPVDGQVVVVTAGDVARLVVDGSGLTRQPPGAQVLRSKPFIVYTSGESRTYATTVVGTGVEVEVTPVSFLWDWGDGTSTVTSDPGRSWPDQTVFHHYSASAVGVRTSLTTTWSARFRPSGGAQWQEVVGTVTTTETSTPYDVVRATTVLTDDAEEAQGH